jgi:hypothetical protein
VTHQTPQSPGASGIVTSASPPPGIAIPGEPTAKEATDANPVDGRAPSPDLTRLLVQDGPIPIRKARLPEAPKHPRALETLAEGVALWYGRPLYAALGVAAADALCVSPRCHATVDGLARTPLVTIDLVVGPPRRAAAPGSPASATSLTCASCASGSRGHDRLRAARADPRLFFADLLFQVITRRYEKRSLVLTTNLPFSDWPPIFPNAGSAIALIDRLVHHAEIITIEGDSYRRRVAEAKRKPSRPAAER